MKNTISLGRAPLAFDQCSRRSNNVDDPSAPVRDGGAHYAATGRLLEAGQSREERGTKTSEGVWLKKFL